ncbi:MAG: hypothetical protein RLY78_221 [Pseudomonadota bacterium]
MTAATPVERSRLERSTRELPGNDGQAGLAQDPPIMWSTLLTRLPSDAAPLRLMAGAVLYRQGDGPGDSVWVVEQGLMRLERVAEEGTRRIVGLAGVGDLLGHDGLCGGPHASEAVACAAVQLRRVPLDVLSHDALAATRLLRQAARALAAAQAWSAEVVAGPAADRVRHLLTRLAEHEDADGLCWLPSRQEMAAMLDLRHETVSRHVSALRQQGLISVSQGSRARLHRLRHTGPTTGAGLEAGTPGRGDRPLPPPPPVVADAALARARAADGRVSGLGIGSGALVWAGLLAELAWLD